MSDWRSAWRLARFTWKKDWPGMAFTFLFAMYVGAIVGLPLDRMIGEESSVKGSDILIDWMYLMMFPVFGLLMNRSAFGISRDDVYTRKIAYWLTMPISRETILKARLLHSLLLVPVIGLSFMLLQYGISSALRDSLSLGGWLAVGWIWICYALAMNALLIGLELGCSGRRYVRYYWLLLAGGLIISAVATWGGVHLVRGTIAQMEEDRYVWLPVSPIAAAAALYAGYRLTLNRMRKRSYVL